MDNLGAILGQTYAIPRQTFSSAYPISNPQSQSQPFNDGLDFEKNLENVEGLTREYYEKVIGLKSFMADMHNNLGIDVRVPDLRNPESIRLNQIYQKGLADILNQANKLKVGQMERSSHIMRGDVQAQGTDDQSSTVGPSKWYDDKLTPRAAAHNSLMGQSFYDSAEFSQAMKQHEDKVKEITSEIADAKLRGDKAGVERLTSELHSLVAPIQKEKQFAPERSSYQSRRGAQRERNAGIALKKAIILGNKLAPSTATNIVGEDGRIIRQHNDYNGFKYGASGKVIKTIEVEPGKKDGGVTIQFTDGTSTPFPKDKRMFVSALASGQRMGYTDEDIDSYIDNHGIDESNGSVSEGWALKDIDQKAIKDQQDEDEREKEEIIKPIISKVGAQLDEASASRFFWSPDNTIDFGNGIQVPYKKSSDGKFSLDKKTLGKLFSGKMVNGKTGKVDPVLQKQLVERYTDKPKDVFVKNLLMDLPLGDLSEVMKQFGITPPKRDGSYVEPTSEKAEREQQNLPKESSEYAKKRALELLKKY